MKNSTKDLYYEILRIIAICCVIFNHTGNNGFFLFTVSDSPIEYALSLLLAILCKMGVPIFFMISGALLIPKEEDLKTLFTKRILRIVIVIVLFSFLLYVRQYIQHPEYGFGLFYFAKLIYSQEFVTPYWFLYSYLTILLLLPFIRRMARNMTREEYMYLLVLGVSFRCLIPIFDYFLGAGIHLNPFICESGILFFLLGYGMEHVLEEDEYNKKGCAVLGAAALLSVMISGAMVYLEYKRGGVYTENYITLFVPILTVMLYYYVRYWCKRHIAAFSEKGKNLILYVGSCTFGIYLLEEILRTDMDGMFAYLCPPIPPLLVCLIYILAVMVVGTVVVLILKRIPGLKKLL